MIASTTAVLGVVLLVGYLVAQFPPPGIGADHEQRAARARAWAAERGLVAPCASCHASGAHEHDCPAAAKRSGPCSDPNDDASLRGLAEDDYLNSRIGEGRKGVGP